MPERQIYLLDPQSLPPETIAVTFAKTSRSPLSFREIAAELTDEKSAEFHEKWVVGYGHASVAEHAVLHVALENISRLAVETLELNRLASYTEKSTRYQKWDADSFTIPRELDGHPLRVRYESACRTLLAAYQAALPAVKAVVMQEEPRRDGESDAGWERRIRSEYVDVCRFLLPAASLANVGMTINARALEHAITKMLSHPLEEVRAIGAEVKRVAQTEVPTLVKYAEENAYLLESARVFSDAAAQGGHSAEVGQDWCALVDYDRRAEDGVLAAALYRFGEMPYRSACEQIANANAEERAALAHALLGSMDRHDIPLRELEYSQFTFDLIMDQGAYFEVKRHRMMTQTPQSLTARLGYAVPRRMVAAGLETEYRAAMELARQVYEELAAFNAQVASYVVPNGFNRRVLLRFNMRAGRHFISLRSADNAHFSVRRVAARIAEEICAAAPVLGGCIQGATGQSWQEIEREYFAAAA